MFFIFLFLLNAVDNVIYFITYANAIVILRYVIIGLQVEDMLKRSFAEFHAQKKLPEMQELLKRKLNQPTKAIEYVLAKF